ncbi:MAG: tRNA (adenosine(37)-N6)-threonylcarbamoyltransferase complex transferase subunit TsaD [Clostridia bacterium]|nr:tRNA (adenosine(37)-N6)-threonylcarbamoyltransferase complex transferase subunit TsaD [Clostridia bacterium]
MKILAIESSCDETAAAVVEDGRKVLSNVVNSQIEIHKKYGGVVPEIASRAHTEALCPVVSGALEEAGLTLEKIDALAVTYTPGLVGALLAGVSFAKGLSLASGLPLIPVNHMRGHIAALYPAHPELEPPFFALVLSGGHTEIVKVNGYTSFELLGATADDAAGECFDKTARVLGIGYPGGKELDMLSGSGNARNCPLPPPIIKSSEFDFSFSGLKTAVINLVHNAEQKNEVPDKADVAAGFTKAVCAGIEDRMTNLFDRYEVKKLGLVGGVAANSSVRKTLDAICRKRGAEFFVPPVSLCGDNGAMIGAQAYYEYLDGNLADGALNAVPSGEL